MNSNNSITKEGPGSASQMQSHSYPEIAYTSNTVLVENVPCQGKWAKQDKLTSKD